MLPKDYPPYQTVYWNFRTWKLNGLWKRIHEKVGTLHNRQVNISIIWIPAHTGNPDHDSKSNEECDKLAKRALTLPSHLCPPQHLPVFLNSDPYYLIYNNKNGKTINHEIRKDYRKQALSNWEKLEKKKPYGQAKYIPFISNPESNAFVKTLDKFTATFRNKALNNGLRTVPNIVHSFKYRDNFENLHPEYKYKCVACLDHLTKHLGIQDHPGDITNLQMLHKHSPDHRLLRALSEDSLEHRMRCTHTRNLLPPIQNKHIRSFVSKTNRSRRKRKKKDPDYNLVLLTLDDVHKAIKHIKKNLTVHSDNMFDTDKTSRNHLLFYLGLRNRPINNRLEEIFHTSLGKKKFPTLDDNNHS